MACEMIRMGVGNEGLRLRVPWVQPQVEFRQVQTSLETNFNQWTANLNRDSRNRQGKPGIRVTSISACSSRTPVGRIFAMDLSKFATMDPHLLVGLLNTELRNHCASLDDLVKTHNLDPDVLAAKMAGAGYIYRAEQNQFR